MEKFVLNVVMFHLLIQNFVNIVVINSNDDNTENSNNNNENINSSQTISNNKWTGWGQNRSYGENLLD